MPFRNSSVIKAGVAGMVIVAVKFFVFRSLAYVLGLLQWVGNWVSFHSLHIFLFMVVWLLLICLSSFAFPLPSPNPLPSPVGSTSTSTKPLLFTVNSASTKPLPSPANSASTESQPSLEPMSSPVDSTSTEPLPSPADSASTKPLPSPANSASTESQPSLEAMPSPDDSTSTEPLPSPVDSTSTKPLPSPANSGSTESRPSLELMPSPADSASIERLPTSAVFASAGRALSRVLSALFSAPVASRKYDVIRSLANQILCRNLNSGVEELRELNRAALAVVFKRTVVLLEASIEQEVRLARRMDLRSTRGIWAAQEEEEQRCASVEKLAAETMWLGQKMAESRAASRAVTMWGSLLSLPVLTISLKPKFQNVIVRVCEFMFKLDSEKLEGDTDSTSSRLAMAKEWLPLFLQIQKGSRLGQNIGEDDREIY